MIGTETASFTVLFSCFFIIIIIILGFQYFALLETVFKCNLYYCLVC